MDNSKLIAGKFELHRNMLDEFEADGGFEVIGTMSELIIDSISNGGVVYICGNGGSAADALHIAGEFVGRFLRERKALPAVALTADSAIITAIGNDYDYSDIFSRQVEALAKSGDVLWGISTSGNSANIVKAAELAKSKGAKVVGFTGRKGSKLEDISDVCLVAAAEKSFASQEIHVIAYHIICDIVEKHFAEN